MYRPDLEARALAWQRAKERQGSEIVRASFRAEDWAARPDPTDILGPADQPAVSLTIVVDTEALAAAFKALGQAIDSIFSPIAKAVGDLAAAMTADGSALAELFEALQALDRPAALNRTRHGSGAVCPRHGPTVGGLCRPCSRRR